MTSSSPSCGGRIQSCNPRIMKSKSGNEEDGGGGRPVPFDFSCGEPDDAVSEDREGGARERDRRKRQIKRLARFWTAIFAVLLGGTVYSVGLNYYINYVKRKSVEEPITFSVRYGSGARENRLYAGVKWDAVPDSSSTLLPVIKIGDTVLSESDASTLDMSGDSLQARIIVPHGTRHGLYEGRIVFATNEASWRKCYLNPKQTDENTFNFNIRFDVMSFWEEWDLLEKWIYIAVSAWIALYLICLKSYPAPRGSLELGYYHNHNTEKAFMKLKNSLASWLCPWTRSTVDLNGIVRKQRWAESPEANLPDITIDFQLQPYNRIMTFGDLSDCKISRQFQRKFKRESGASMSGYDSLCENPKSWYVYWVNETDYIVFSYSSLLTLDLMYNCTNGGE